MVRKRRRIPVDEDTLERDDDMLVVRMKDDLQDDLTSPMETDEDLIPVRKGSSSSVGSAESISSVITTFGLSQFNQPVLLVIDPHKQDGEINILFTPLRPKTKFGKTQGDHVIAHRLFLAFCARIIVGKSLTEMPQMLDKAFKELIPNIEEQLVSEADAKDFPKLPASSDFPKNDQQFMKDNEKTHPNEIAKYKLGVRVDRVEIVNNYLCELLSYYNNMPDVVNEKTGNKEGSEGRNIASSMVALNLINTCLSMTDTEEEHKVLYKKAMVPNGEFVPGMHMIFGKGIKEIRKDYTRKPNKENEFYQDLLEKLQDEPAIIGRLIEHLFDFPILENEEDEENEEEEAQYEKESEEESDEGNEERTEQDLAKMSHRCIEMVFKTFPELSKLDNREKITTNFLKEVFKQQGWGEDQDYSVDNVIKMISETFLEQKGDQLHRTSASTAPTFGHI